MKNQLQTFEKYNFQYDSGFNISFLAKNGLECTKDGKGISCVMCDFQLSLANNLNIISIMDIKALHIEHNPKCKFVQDFVNLKYKPTRNLESFVDESLRLSTFSDWPLDQPDPASLAKDGFYYTKEGTICRCIFCRGMIGFWKKQDIPRNEHKRHFPTCPFINGIEVGNKNYQS
nr:MAG: baculoviral IAP repeat-containing protein [Metapenaeopsis lamellata majanivirus]